LKEGGADENPVEVEQRKFDRRFRLKNTVRASKGARMWREGKSRENHNKNLHLRVGRLKRR